jgi:hypothetical protein
MTTLSDRNTLGPPTPVLTPPACLRSPTHNAIQFRLRIRLPERGHPPHRKADIGAHGKHRDASTVATDLAAATQTPIAPRR